MIFGIDWLPKMWFYKSGNHLQRGQNLLIMYQTYHLSIVYKLKLCETLPALYSESEENKHVMYMYAHLPMDDLLCLWLMHINDIA